MSTNAVEPGYDIIGDVHGYASKLEALLRKLGYQLRNGCYRHPSRQAAFVGDYIDRGPEIRRTLQVVRAMVEGRTAYAVMGNHEFNAIAFDTFVEGRGWLRDRNEATVRQHQETLRQVGERYPAEWKEWLDWFNQLPLVLELNGIRVVHAAWRDDYAQLFASKPRLTASLIIAMADPRTQLGAARERLLRGIKVPVPIDPRPSSAPLVSQRRFVRAKWWMDLSKKTVRELALPARDDLPESYPMPTPWSPEDRPYPTSDVPVFVGHYRLPFDDEPRPLAANVACLDYSVAAGGPLVAYAWSGENSLRQENFVTA